MPEPHDDQFKHELRELLNRHSMENASDTPDFILANYLCDCLEAWNLSVTQRSGWYKRSAAVTPEQQPNDLSYAEVSTDDIKRMNEHAKDAAYTPEKDR